MAEKHLLAAARRSFELEKLARLEFALCMADLMLGKSLDCWDQAEHSMAHFVNLVGDFGELAEHLVAEAAVVEDFEVPSEAQRCCSFVVLQGASDLLVAAYAAASKSKIIVSVVSHRRNFRILPATTATCFVMSQRVVRGTRDYGEALDDTSCTRLLCPCSESLGSSGSNHNFRREFSGCVRDLAVAAQVCENKNANDKNHQ